MKIREDSSYWERACHFFRFTGLAESEGSYFIHNKNNMSVKIGIFPQVRITVNSDQLACTENGTRSVITSQSDDPIFRRVEKLLKTDAPCFFLVSPDIYRRFIDKGLPQILAVQPSVEFTFCSDQDEGKISYALDFMAERQGDLMLRDALKQPLSVRPDDPGEPLSFSELAAGWNPAEDDESFLKRLAKAISALQDYPDGKLTLTRAYEHRVVAKPSPFQLYELHSRVNGEYACSHFFCIRKDVFSVGTSPENVLEISDKTLTVDVVAATCKSGGSEEYLAKELYENPKQVREHQSSLTNRQNRFNPFCKEGTLEITQGMQIKVLRNVCHLHSVFVGELLPDVTIFELMGNIFPLLGARPRELLAVGDSELAPHRYYGGVVGHTHQKSGGCFFNIRNALLVDDVMHAKVGVGIIKESKSYDELLETQDKLSGLLEAVHLWEQTVMGETRSDLPEKQS